MIRRTAVRIVRPVWQKVRALTLRLAGFPELQARLERQENSLRAIEQTLGRLERFMWDRSAHQDLLTLLAHVGPTLASVSEKLDHAGVKLESISKEQATTNTRIVEEIDRLDGFLIFHVDELRSAMAERAARAGEGEAWRGAA